jgi:hypothetical protein
MKNANDFIEDKCVYAKDYKRRTTTLRRLAGGLQSEIEKAKSSGLTDKEIRTLVAAADLLSSMATVQTKAKVAAAHRESLRAKREKEVQLAIAGNFGKLTSLMDRLCLIAAVRPFGCDLLKLDIKDLNYNLNYIGAYAQDAINDLVYKLSGQPGPVSDIVADAWAKFEAARPEYEVRYAVVAQRLNQGNKAI